MKNSFISLQMQQKKYFHSGRTKSIEFRISMLKKLKKIIEQNEQDILRALSNDLHKSITESYTSEISYVLKEIRFFIKYLNKLRKKERVRTPFINKPGKSYYQYEPYGTVLIISPWNYPFALLFSPLIGAIAAGNCIIAKPSEISKHTSNLIYRILSENFDKEYIAVVEGDAESVQALINDQIDYIFFTGSTSIGKIIMKSAAEYLIPVTLELGGKNPCIVDSDVNIEVAAKRIAWGKFFNAGQTCVAPDYVLLHRDIKDKFVEQLITTIKHFYTEKDFTHIVNDFHFDRLTKLMAEEKIIEGGICKKENLYISPTLITDINHNSKLMDEEIFGPILPIIIYEDLELEIKKLNASPKPLVLYYFSNDKVKHDKIINMTSSGSVCINGTIHILLSTELPFGGVGESGMGRYHGIESFETFSNKKSILKKSFWGDLKAVYPPYDTPLKILKKAIKFLY